MKTCKDVSYQLSTGEVAHAPLLERAAVWLHLAMCRNCRVQSAAPRHDAGGARRSITGRRRTARIVRAGHRRAPASALKLRNEPRVDGVLQPSAPAALERDSCHSPIA